jgi:hypothetical protein
MRFLKRGNIFAVICFAYIIWWLVTFSTWITPLVNSSEFMIWEGGIYLGTLTSMQGTAIILFATAGGLATMCATLFLLIKLGNKISARLATLKIENCPTYNPAPTTYPEDKMYPLEIGKGISTIMNYLKANPLKTGIPLIILGPAMWQAFNIYAQNQAPKIGQVPMFQLLTIAIPILSILSIVTGTIIITSHYYKKIKIGIKELKDKKIVRFKFIRAHREGIGIIMLATGWFYFLWSLLVWRGWIWIDKSNAWCQFMTEEEIAKLLYLNSVGFILFIVSIIVFVTGFIIFKPGDEPNHGKRVTEHH